MSNIPRSLREIINQKLYNLETIDFDNVSLDEIESAGLEIVEILESNNIDAASDYYKRLDNFLKSLDDHNKKKKISEIKGKRDYVGMSGIAKIRVTGVYDHYFLSRVYGGNLKVSWRFNSKGRIDLIDLMLFPKNQVFHLMAIFDYKSCEPEWNNNQGWYRELPEALNKINNGFYRLSIEKKLESLTRFGHSMSKHLINNLKSGDIRDSHVVQKDQMQIKDIVYDDILMAFLYDSATILPNINLLNQRSFNITYFPRTID